MNYLDPKTMMEISKITNVLKKAKLEIFQPNSRSILVRSLVKRFNN